MPAEFGEKCAVFGAFGDGFEAARLVHTGLFALQHRGEDNSGITSSDGKEIYVHKGVGLVSHVYDERSISRLKGCIAAGHNRYPTSGGPSPELAQPVTSNDNLVTLMHNGNFPIVDLLKKDLIEKGVDISDCNDSKLAQRALSYRMKQGWTIEEAVIDCFGKFTGAFSILIMTRDKLIAIRDQFGIRPFCIGKLNGGWIFSSETCALNAVGATYIRDVNPGEMVVVDRDGMKSTQVIPGYKNTCNFEFVYFARPDSIIDGKSVYEVRKRLGINMAIEGKVDADIVIPVPNSGIPTAIGYYQRSGIPIEFGLVKNPYIDRTFIMPEQHLRERAIETKFNPIREVLEGKRVVVIDDSIVRGTTQRAITRMLREYGAREVHVRIPSPPIKYPDFYGIDTPYQRDLIAARMSEDEIRAFIGADSLRYLSYEALLDAIGLPEDQLCLSCYNGKYPIDIGEANMKQLMKTA